LDQISVNYAFDLSRYAGKTVTVALDGVSLSKCVQAILELAMAASESGIQAVLWSRHSRLQMRDYKLSPRYPMEDTIYVKCNKENAYLAAYAAADASGESFSLPEEFKERICTAILSGKSLKQALQTIAEQVKNHRISSTMACSRGQAETSETIYGRP